MTVESIKKFFNNLVNEDIDMFVIRCLRLVDLFAGLREATVVVMTTVGF